MACSLSGSHEGDCARESASPGGPVAQLHSCTARQGSEVPVKKISSLMAAAAPVTGPPADCITASQQGGLSCLPALLVRSPERQVVAEQLHDERGVLVRVLCHVVQLRNGILEGGAGHFARLVRIRQDLVHEDRVVQGQAQADGVGHCQVFLRHRLRICISCTGALRRLGLGVAIGELGNVAVVVGLHLLVENLRLAAPSRADELAVQEIQDGVADLLELRLHL
mmetsp:Transcript_10933/g.29224  ORF Transcript_10933/g.29224 Transcript_10933/m.29224 type:complete len:224 (+) Transcript_10933:50-721(+)